MIDVLLVIFSALLISAGFFLVRNIDRDLNDTHANMIFFGGIILMLLGGLILIKIFSWEILKRKFVGLIIAIAGYWLAFRFPDATDYQQEGFGWTGVIIGVAVMIIGGYFLLV